MEKSSTSWPMFSKRMRVWLCVSVDVVIQTMEIYVCLKVLKSCNVKNIFELGCLLTAPAIVKLYPSNHKLANFVYF